MILLAALVALLAAGSSPAPAQCNPEALPHPSIDLVAPQPGSSQAAGPLDIVFVTSGVKTKTYGYAWDLMKDVLLVPEDGPVIATSTWSKKPSPPDASPSPDPALVHPTLVTFHFDFVFPKRNYRIVLEWEEPTDPPHCEPRRYRESFGSISTTP